MNFKKLLAMLLCVAMVAVFAACNNTGDPVGSESVTDNGKVSDTETSAPAGDTDDEGETSDDTSEEPLPIPENADVSELEWTSATSATEGFDIRKNNNGSAVTLGNGSYSFDKSLVVVPAAGEAEASAVEILYELETMYFAFATVVGVDDSSAGGSVEFLVYADDALISRTGTMTKGEYMYLTAEIYGCSEVKLVVTNADGDNTGDTAVWAAPTLFAGMDLLKYEPSLPADVDVFLDEVEWTSVSCLHSDTKGAPFIDKNESGGALSMGNSFHIADKGLWLHPNYGEDAWAEVVMDLSTADVSTFVAAFGLSDEYVGACNGYGGVVDASRRSIQFIFLVDDVEVASFDIINSLKIGTVSIDVSNASSLTIRMTSYDGTHTCDAGVITGGFVK